ncbi:MAG: carboxypeptidase-like regulatory domain-containing protein [Planctomycetaceae bacterium]|jgi:hypothetical protein|nr:carboxypeptidase-like regulatory domain-containing protein [Planctomycetaceae bacterium]
MTKQIISLFCLSILTYLCLFPLGCIQKLPPGIPTLYPAEITIIQDGKPLADASVVIINLTPSVNWSGGGNTNKNGVLKLKTMGQYHGVPLGKYKVSVQKIEYPGDIVLPLNPPYEDKAAMKEYNRLLKKYEDNTFQLVDNKFSLINTPLVFEVTPQNLRITLDVSPAIRMKAPTSPQG